MLADHWSWTWLVPTMVMRPEGRVGGPGVQGEEVLMTTSLAAQSSPRFWQVFVRPILL